MIRPTLGAELRALVPMMREDADCHRAWERWVHDNPDAPHEPPAKTAGDEAWHRRWADFYEHAAVLLGEAADAIAPVAGDLL